MERWVITVTDVNGKVLDRWYANTEKNHAMQLEIAKQRYPLAIITVTREKSKFNVNLFGG